MTSSSRNKLGRPSPIARPTAAYNKLLPASAYVRISLGKTFSFRCCCKRKRRHRQNVEKARDRTVLLSSGSMPELDLGANYC